MTENELDTLLTETAKTSKLTEIPSTYPNESAKTGESSVDLNTDDDDSHLWESDNKTLNVDRSGEVNADEVDKELMENASKLSKTVRHLGSDIDEKLGVTNTAKFIDEKIHISQGAKSVWNWVGSTVGNINSKYKVTEKTSEAVSAIDEKIHVSETAKGVGSSLRSFDTQHRVSARAVGTLASGADFLAKNITGKGADELDGTGLMPETSTGLELKEDDKVEDSTSKIESEK
eukprot:CAMPEP_0195518862 /NCGR_PEP_ID=MMETSP0794_2-20130614/13818_1 /TAXON_ID=515487 /ORGANISM="Stephanopyxis turris, Strain CCMP 815" /LENGTH=231 /DNA_ID=CAMNT_0040647893 /DNA_START=133 /DNA_END=828 /DNA_ORIENTATION=+